MMAALRKRFARPEVTAAHISRALAAMRTPRWPATDEEALAHRVIGPCVRALALDYARAEAHAPSPRQQPRHTTSMRPPHGTSWCRVNPTSAYDAKRAAANDLDKDDE